MLADRNNRLCGATLIELMVALAIVGILAAVAIPLVSSYARDSRISEAVGNVQGLLEAEAAFFVRFGRYTLPLDWCPTDLPEPGETQNWDENCAGEWPLLGWRPNSTALYFHYRVFTSYGESEGRIIPMYHPTNNEIGIAPGMDEADGYVPNRSLSFGVDWDTEANPDPDGDGNADVNDMPSWCAVEAEADTDGDGNEVYIRANSINHKHVKVPNPRDHGNSAW